MRITVIGTGYLGAVHAACMADLGHAVLGVDTDAEKIAALAGDRVPFFEPGLSEVLSRGIGSGNLRFGTSLAEAARFGEVHFVCVGTPQLPGLQAADLSAVHAVIDTLVPQITRDCLIVGKSTVPVGTASRLAARIGELARTGVDVELAWNPEFLREGFAVHDTLQPNRLVAGVASDGADAILRAVYAPIIQAGVPYIATDLASAELVKVSANAFLATKISFINAIADVCDAAGADVNVVASAMGFDERIGRRFLAAGVGFGGGCLPKDIRALMASAAELGVTGSVGFLREVDEVNTSRRRRAVDIATDLLGGSLLDRNVAVLGAAFKPDTDDVRDSPALSIAAAMQRAGARVRVHDPKAADNARKAAPALSYGLDVPETCDQADIVLHLTEWPEYREVDPQALGAIVRRRCLFDGRNALALDHWRSAGWTARALGRPAESAARLSPQYS
jgi:UDPglucose 6-dehydrogenase